VRLPLAIGTLVAALAFPAVAAADDAIVVKRVPGLDRAERADLRADAGVRLEAALPLRDTELVVAKDGDVEAAVAALEADADVVYAEPEIAVSPATGDPSLPSEWGLHNTGQTIFTPGTPDADIDAPEAWAITRGAGATAAVVDTGIELTHPDLAGQFWSNAGETGGGKETNGIDDDHNGYVDDWRGWDFVNNDNAVDTQSSFHGTHVGGTIAAATDNGIGVAGVAPDARILPLKIFGAPGTTASSSTIAVAFDYAGDLGVDVVNASLGGLGTSQVVTDVMNAHPNTLYVVSAGNDYGADAASYMPCNSPAANLVCVGASTNVDAAADFSNVSATAVDLFAPGAYVLSTTLSSSYSYANGTSMAAPHVSGAVALLAGKVPAATVAQLRAALLSSVDAKAAFAGLSATGGRLNAAGALAALAVATTPPAASPDPVVEPPVASPDPSPSPSPSPSPPAPVRTPAAAILRSLRITGAVTSRRPAKVAYALSADAPVTAVIRCAGVRSCTHKVRLSGAARGFELRRRQGGRLLAAGRYTLTLSAPGGSTRRVGFVVR
jgi:subtilisin family serine protease